MQLLEDVLLQVIFRQASIVFASWLAYARIFRRTPLVGTLFLWRICSTVSVI